ncbi:MAG TPA: glycerophosphoryl diester phosphodiesterase membrane domain-containing protein [Candidatus Paceibacterota bacterium]|nr:glycerophosphoryl diester phosphodiesterase membrane domain-containing protein [Candidatus Paceibacterota bacterium]
MQFIFKIGSKIREAWPIYKANFGVFLLLMVFTLVVQALGSNRHWALVLISYVASIFVSFMWVRFVLNLIDKKESNPFKKESLPTLSQYWNLFKTIILNALCVLLGLVLLVIPAFYISGRLIFAMYLSVDKNQGGRKSIKESWEMTRGYGWLLFWKSFVIGLFIALGIIAFFIGSFITYPIGMLIYAMMYREFSKMKLENPITPVSAEVVN